MQERLGWAAMGIAASAAIAAPLAFEADPDQLVFLYAAVPPALFGVLAMLRRTPV